ncbi:MAG: DUF115 domain-containing protein [Spirochaetaceae bacterium]|jgi:hypothetical protein|nr:DUF115 domain-containing protein [Spirochaetaceae bacterium]
MPQFREKNLTALKKNYPLLAESLERYHEKYGSDAAGDKAPSADCGISSIEIIPASSGVPSLKINGTFIHSARDPQREARRLAEAALGAMPFKAGQESTTARLSAEKKGTVVILGFGLGYAAEEAARLAPGRPILIVEKRLKVFSAALDTRDLSAFFLNTPLTFLLGGETSALNAALNSAGGIRALIRNQALLALDNTWAAEVQNAVDLWKNKDEINEATLRRFGKRWVRNLGTNLDAIRDLPGAALLAGQFDFPLFVAAAGPSLDKIKPYLPEIHERCLIIAVDTSIRFLERSGIHPDFTVSVDPQYWNTRHLDRADLSKTCLIAESSVYPSTVRVSRSSHPIFLGSSFFPIGRFIEERIGIKGALGAGGSVATTAWDFARSLLSDPLSSPLFVAGLDLAFPHLKTHFKGALFEERALSTQDRFLPAQTLSFQALHDAQPFLAPASSGDMVFTDKRLSLYARWFESRAEGALPRVFSLSDEGLAIKGFKLAAIEDLLSLPKRRKEVNKRLEDVFSAIYADWENAGAKEKRTQVFREAKKSLLSGLEEFYTVSRNAALATENAMKKQGKTENQEAVLREIGKANAYLTGSRVKDIAGFLMPHIEKLEAALETPAEKPLERYLELSAKLYHELALQADFNLRSLSR